MSRNGKVKTEGTRIYNKLVDCQRSEAEEDINALIKMTEHTRKHHVNTLWNYYGARELSYVGITKKELMVYTEKILRDEIIRRWRKNKVSSNGQSCNRSIYSYMNIYFRGELKTYICEKFGVSKYYVDILISFKKAGLDIWKSDDEDLCDFLMESRNIKHPKSVLQKIRNEFRNPETGENRRYYSSTEILNYLSLITGATKNNVRWVYNMLMDGINLWHDDPKTVNRYICEHASVKFPETLRNHLYNLFDETLFRATIKDLERSGVLPEIPFPEKRESRAEAPYIEISSDEIPDKIYEIDRNAVNYISEETGVSNYYAKVLLSIKAYGMDIYNTDEGYLQAVLTKEFPEKKNPAITVARIQEKFRKFNLEYLFSKAGLTEIIPSTT